jgi:hypothetical protein
MPPGGHSAVVGWPGPRPSTTMTSVSPENDTGRTAPWTDYAYGLLMPD